MSKTRKMRRIRKGGMQDFNQMVISNYSPMTSRGGTNRKTRRKMNRKRRTVRH